jgi:hypothetical protein
MAMFKGRAYEPVGVEPYVNRNGRDVWLALWRGSCEVCEAEFVVKQAVRAKFEPTRRCPEHRIKKQESRGGLPRSERRSR